MKLIMAISRNGYVARSASDDMSWTGPIDKAVFKLLTSTHPVLAVSAKTLEYMPKSLPGRGKRYALSTDPRKGVSLEDMTRFAPDAWLLGGQEIALYALKNGFVTKAYLCIADTDVEPGPGAIQDRLRPYFEGRRYVKGRGSWWDQTLRVTIDSLMVEVWERGSAINNGQDS